MRRIFSTIIGIILGTTLLSAQNLIGQQDTASGLWGFKDSTGNWVIAPEFNFASQFSEGLAGVCMNGKWGYINPEGEVAIPCQFDDATYFSEKLAGACKDGKWGFINRSGAMVIPFQYEEIRSFIDGLAPVKENGEWSFIDSCGYHYNSKSEYFPFYAKSIIEPHVNKWQQKGRYEKTEDYLERVNSSTRQKFIDSLTLIVRNSFISRNTKNLRTAQKLIDYDADNEVFLINDTRFGEILVPVPIDRAPEFEHQFSSLRKQSEYGIADGHLALTSVTYLMADGSTFTYSDDSDIQYADVNIEYQFDPVDINMDRGQDTRDNLRRTGSRTLTVGRSAVDTDIPRTGRVAENTFAVIIANENYDTESSVEFAGNDGTVFSQYCEQTLGIPESNIHIVYDATLNNIRAQVNWLSNVGNAWKGEARLIFYYAGHGIPDESSKEAYILPSDGYGSDVATGYRLSELYSQLSSIPSQSTVVFLDACFSGASRDDGMLSSVRGVAIKVRNNIPDGRLIVFSAAQKDETALPYNEMGHGMFTYFLLDKLRETKGDVTLGELSDYIKEMVGKQSIVSKYRKPQTPGVTVGKELENLWRGIKL